MNEDCEAQAVLIETPVAAVPQVLKRIRAGWIPQEETNRWSDFEQKQHALSQLKALQRLIQENLDQVSAALKADLNKISLDLGFYLQLQWAAKN
uniref:Uncharacterized protein n=1 Tax=Amphimedon queenslandica TaxID=400682 RepID=A0A1X7UCI3_AMPQE